jgi:hypothetical protein
MKMYNGIVSAKASDVEHLRHGKPIKISEVDEYPYSAVGIIKILRY